MTAQFDIRQSRRDLRRIGWSKALLVEALSNMQSICPPRVSRQSKADLEHIVRVALGRDDDVGTAMQGALADARTLGL